MKFLFLALLFTSYIAAASPTKVGNGDDGADLENLQLVKSGILLSTRDKAVLKVKDLNLKSVTGLGYLEGELKNAEIYLSSNNVQNPKEFDRGLEVSKDGKDVYARTMARPHSPVRFFPSALMLSEEQLIRLHIHEALHRALPENIRENESIVSEVTLAIMAPNASRDSVEYTVKKYRDYTVVKSLPPESLLPTPPPQPQPVVETVMPYKGMSKPSAIRLIYRTVEPSDNYGIRFNEILTLDGTYFLNKDDGLGFFASFSYLKGEPGIYEEPPSQLGPLGLGVEYALPVKKNFKVSTAVKQFFYLKNEDPAKFDSRMRDVTSLEVSLRREVDNYFLDGGVRLLLKSKILNLPNTSSGQEYSPITFYHVSAGRKFGPILAQLKFEYVNSNGKSLREIPSGAYNTQYIADGKSFTLRILKPEIGYVQENLRVSVYAALLTDGSTPKYSLDDLGDMSVSGFGKSLFGSSLSYHF
ncbi:hypothetical protein D3C87_144530 [compost metagenome]